MNKFSFSIFIFIERENQLLDNEKGSIVEITILNAKYFPSFS
jgi:hypothetical protein